MIPIMLVQTRIDLDILEKELTAVRKELAVAGFYDASMRNVDVYLVPFKEGRTYRCWGGDGNIAIPEVSMSTLRILYERDPLTLRDVLRHSYGHAYAETHREALQTDAFIAAFQDAYTSSVSWRYDPDVHITPYAAKGPAEDFAEVFMEFVARKGKRPRHFSSEAIITKWRYVASLSL